MTKKPYILQKYNKQKVKKKSRQLKTKKSFKNAIKNRQKLTKNSKSKTKKKSKKHKNDNPLKMENSYKRLGGKQQTTTTINVFAVIIKNLPYSILMTKSCPGDLLRFCRAVSCWLLWKQLKAFRRITIEKPQKPIYTIYIYIYIYIYKDLSRFNYHS